MVVPNSIGDEIRLLDISDDNFTANMSNNIANCNMTLCYNGIYATESISGDHTEPRDTTYGEMPSNVSAEPIVGDYGNESESISHENSGVTDENNYSTETYESSEELKHRNKTLRHQIKCILKIPGLSKSKRRFYNSVLKDLNIETHDQDTVKVIDAFVNLMSGRIVVPNHFKDIAGNAHKDEWLEACRRELASHQKNGTWKVETLPSGKKVIGSRWVFVLKLNPDGSVKRFKARFVAQGFTQSFGLDYLNTYAPVVGMSTVRWFFYPLRVNEIGPYIN